MASRPALSPTATRSPVRFVEAEVAIDEVMSVREPRFGATGWSGVVKLMSRADGLGLPRAGHDGVRPVVVPEVLPLTVNDERIAVAFWVGLDGAPSLPEEAAKPVLRACIAAQVNPSFFGNTLEWWAWTG